jgi:FkbM family methyltransferase
LISYNIVQLGCFRFLDPHIQKYVTNKYTTYLVDANIEALNKIDTKDNPNIILINIAISNSDGFITFYKTSKGIENDYVASIYKEHLYKHGEFNPKETTVKSSTFNNLITNILKIKHINVLYIDIEGADNLVLKEIIDHNINVDSIVFETSHIDTSNYSNLEKIGYKYIQLDNYNSCFYKNELPFWEPT